jgi:hypothetical protein
VSSGFSWLGLLWTRWWTFGLRGHRVSCLLHNKQTRKYERPWSTYVWWHASWSLKHSPATRLQKDFWRTRRTGRDIYVVACPTDGSSGCNFCPITDELHGIGSSVIYQNYVHTVFATNLNASRVKCYILYIHENIPH